MRDPHVVSLRYRLETDGSVDYTKAPPLDDERDAFSLYLADDTLTCEMKRHFASVAEARAVVDPFLRAWELDVALRRGRGELSFVYEDAEIIDRDPPPPGSPQVVLAGVAEAIALAGEATVHISRGKYPEPPKHFRITPDVETLWHRYEGYLEGKEPLLSMTNFCLTCVQSRAGSRKEAARKYGISQKILNRLGEWASDKGNYEQARKFRENNPPLTKAEESWIEAAVKALIRRMGEYEPMASLKQITMNDLPEL